jgi:hypothetical protein
VNDNDPIAWRQWHYWNVMTNMAEVELPKGMCAWTLHIVAEGNMNFAYFDFRPKDRQPATPPTPISVQSCWAR